MSRPKLLLPSSRPIRRRENVFAKHCFPKSVHKMYLSFTTITAKRQYSMYCTLSFLNFKFFPSSKDSCESQKKVQRAEMERVLSVQNSRG